VKTGKEIKKRKRKKFYKNKLLKKLKNRRSLRNALIFPRQISGYA